MATISRIDKIIGLFCRIASLLWGSFAKETYDFIDPTSISHPIASQMTRVTGIYTRDMTHSYVRHDSFVHATTTHSYGRHDFFITCDVTYAHVWHDSFKFCNTAQSYKGARAQQLLEMYNMTHTYVWYDSSIRLAYIIHGFDNTHSYNGAGAQQLLKWCVLILCS